MSSSPTRPIPDTEPLLLERLRQNDADAFETLVRANAGRMLATARRLMRNEEDARDVVQEAFLAAFRALPDFAGQARVSTWLHRITVNAALMKLRSQRRRPELLLDELAPGAEDELRAGVEKESVFPAPDEGIRHRELHRSVRAGLDRLPESYRTALVLRDVEQRDTEETARLLGTTPGAVKTRLHRARQALRALLEPELRAGALG
ncbi:MAG TPA: sigma-70 family RNA polymerase sigma factor [Myxococcota bacterium]|nr:sigma-70 family RNA polymerase sigma factor [Myxococcota bacterium]